MEKGGKYNEVFAHHNAEAYLDAYIDAAGIWEDKKSPLFRTMDRKISLSLRAMHRTDALRMVKRRALAAGLSLSTCNHTFRATGDIPQERRARGSGTADCWGTSKPGRRACTTVATMKYQWTRWSES